MVIAANRSCDTNLGRPHVKYSINRSEKMFENVEGQQHLRSFAQRSNIDPDLQQYNIFIWVFSQQYISNIKPKTSQVSGKSTVEAIFFI